MHVPFCVCCARWDWVNYKMTFLHGQWWAAKGIHVLDTLQAFFIHRVIMGKWLWSETAEGHHYWADSY